jgi:glucokinase
VKAGEFKGSESLMPETSAVGDRCWIGFDLGGTKMLAVVTDEKFQPIARRRRKTRSDEDNSISMARVINTNDRLSGDAGTRSRHRA